MAQDWSTLRELLLPSLGSGRGRALEVALRETVQRLPADARLPSTRDLAAQLGVARGTVTAAYNQLIAEGYLVARHGSGTRVAAAVGRATSAEPGPGAEPGSRAEPGSGAALPSVPERWEYDLGPGLPSLGAFPRSAWQASLRAAMAALPDADLGYTDPAGLAGLRAELVAYLGRVRAVTASAPDVLVTHGTFEALSLLAAELRARGHTEIALEDPCNPQQRRLFELQGLDVVGVAVDGDGLRMDALAETTCRAVLVTSAHQYPLGVALHPARRRALVAWARERDGLVIEDDYDAEYRYDRPALGAVQALDPDRVVYLGTTSKTLAPAMRLGWMVVPPALGAALADRKWYLDRGCNAMMQAGFAHFLASGGYDRHLRRTRPIYRRRRDALLAAVAEHLPAWEPVGIAAGLHVVLRLPPGTSDVAIATRLAEAGIKVVPLSNYAGGSPPYPGLVSGYAGLAPDRLRAAVAAVAAAVNSATGSTTGEAIR